jgi:NADPH:quinone reductase-like Zn-dependent oxidoreductase
MRSVIQRSFGGPEVLEITEVPVPSPLPTEVLVAVHFAGVNPVDAKVRIGKSVAQAMGGLPLTVGWDVAGVVEELGVGVTRFRPGDRVLGFPHFPRAAGAYAEYVTAPSRQFVRVPDNLDLLSASGVPLSGTVAWQIIVDVAQVTEGQIVLILGAGGTVGRFALQIAKSRGARVVGTDTGERLAELGGLGLDEGIDFKTTDFESVIDNVDVVVDLVGGEYSYRAIKVTRPGGLVVKVPSGGLGELVGAAEAAGVRVTDIIVEPDRLALESVVALIESGHVKVATPRAYPFEQVVEVHRILDAGAPYGKMALQIV